MQRQYLNCLDDLCIMFGVECRVPPASWCNSWRGAQRITTFVEPYSPDADGKHLSWSCSTNYRRSVVSSTTTE